MHHSVDTNVLISANGRNTHADIDCQFEAVEFLERIQAASSLLLDQAGEVMSEYQSYCNFVGQPGVGDQFFLWAFQYQGYLAVLELHAHDDRVYEEFPSAPELATFDPPDRKFVALAIAHGDAVVVNALDSDYHDAATALSSAGVSVIELCPHQIRSVD